MKSKYIFLVILIFMLSVTGIAQTHTEVTVEDNQNISGAKNFTNINNVVYADQFAGANCGAKINAAEAALGAAPGEIWVNNNCGTTTWSAVTISHNYHVLRFIGQGPFTVNIITLSGNFDAIIGPAYLTQVGGTDQYTVVATGSDVRILNLTVDGTASQPAHSAVDSCIVSKGSRNWIQFNRVVACQGNAVYVEASATGGDHNTVSHNKLYNSGAGGGANDLGIAVGNISDSAGSFANYNEITDNYVDGTNSDCIFITGGLDSGTLSNGTTSDYNIVNGNIVTNCGDSGIEIGEGSYHTVAENNTITKALNGYLICRDCIEPIFIGNNIDMQSTSANDGISLSSQNLSSTWDQRALVEGNHIKGYITRSCLYTNGTGIHFKDNDCEFSAGISLIHSITDVSNTVTMITNLPLRLPNGTSIIITNTTNYNGTFALTSVNDTTNTYTFTKTGTFATETSGNTAFINSTGSNLIGSGIVIGFNGFSNGSVVGNRIKGVSVGINMNLAGGAATETDLQVSGNWVIQTGTPISFATVTCVRCSISDNHLATYVTVAMNDSSANGSNNSYIYGNTYSPSGFGGTPGMNNANFPSFQSANPYQDSTFIATIRYDSGQLFSAPESSAVPTQLSSWDSCVPNSVVHAVYCSFNGSNPFKLSQTVISGTSTMTAGAVTAASCQTAITTTATGAATTDTIEWAYATAPTLATDALLHISPYVTSGNVNFARCNPTGGSITGTAIVINWKVVR